MDVADSVACAFYGLSPILVPYNQPHTVVLKLLQESGADSLIANAGSLPLSDLCRVVPSLEQIVWVVEKTSRHMDWSGTPEEAEGRVTVRVWHDLVQESQGSAELPAGVVPGNVSMVWMAKQGVPTEIVEFTQKVRLSCRVVDVADPGRISSLGLLLLCLPFRCANGSVRLILFFPPIRSATAMCCVRRSLRSSRIRRSQSIPSLDQVSTLRWRLAVSRRLLSLRLRRPF